MQKGAVKMPTCAVTSCNTNQGNFKSLKLMMHRFPIGDAKLCKIWKQKCRNRNLQNAKHAVVCSKHFSDDAYERDLQSELLGLPTRKRLLKDAVPTLLLSSLAHDSRKDNSRAVRLTKRNARKRALTRIKSSHPPCLTSKNDDESVSMDEEIVPEAENNLKSLPATEISSASDPELEEDMMPKLTQTDSITCVPENQMQTDSETLAMNSVAVVQSAVPVNSKVPVPCCAVRGCNTNRQNCGSLGLVLHRFPMRNEKLCKIWKARCNDPNLLIMTKTVICSKHFSADCYERDLRSELLRLPPKKVLVKNSIPTLFLPLARVEPRTVVAQLLDKENVQSRALLQIGNSFPMATATKQGEENCAMDLDKCTDKNVEQMMGTETEVVVGDQQTSPLLVHVIVSATGNGNGSDCEMNDLKLKNEDLQGQVQRLQNTMSELKKKLEDMKYLSRKLKRAEVQLDTAKSKSEEWKKKYQQECKAENKALYLKEVLRQRFTEAQTNCLMNNIDRPKHWENEDIVEALTLRYFSEKAYRHIRMKKIPYPGLSTITNWVEKFDCSPGKLTNALLFLKCQSLSETEKQCVMVFGEVTLDCRTCYDNRYDVVLGPHKTSLVVMLRGIFKDWQQPIYYNFDTVMTKELLEDLIRDVEGIDYQVVGCVSEIGEKYESLWTLFQITPEKSCFPNPYDGQRNVWVFADIPKLILQLRNHFVDHGFCLPSGKIMTKCDVEMLMAADGPEAKTTHKLTMSHVYFTENDGLQVDLARQLFSRSVAEGLKNVLEFVEESETFQLISDFFNVCNSSVRNDKKKGLSGSCGYTLDERVTVLEDMKRFITTMNTNVIADGSLLQYQTDMLITIASFQGLFQSLKALACGNSYLNTRRLNRECLEKFVERIRTLGKYRETLLPSEFKTRLFLILLGAHADSEVSSEAGEDETGEEKIVTASVLSETSLRIQSDLILGESENDRDILDGQEVEYLLVEVNGDEEVSVQQMFTDEACLKYIAGYIAFQCRDVDPSLTCDITQSVSVIPVWLSSASALQLAPAEPSEQWFETVKEFEPVFSQIHGSTVSKCAGIVQKLQTALEEKYPHFNKVVVKTYSRTRTLMRIKYLNNSRTLIDTLNT